mgnify:CR=1 FL=1|jgi:hypothetical protein
MSTIKVTTVADYTGLGAFTLSGGAISTTGRLILSNITVNGTISGTAANTRLLPSQTGNSGKIMYTDGSTPSWLSFTNNGNIASMQVFSSSGTWNKPTNCRYVHVQVIGGGGGGSGHGESGGSGGYSERIINMSGVSSVSVTVAGEVNGTYYAGGGDNGGTSSFGGYLSASGGYGANRNNQHSGGLAGVGSGGDLNIYGGGGESHHARGGNNGSNSYLGGGVAGGWPQGGNFSHNHQSHSAPGTGGGGAHYHNHRGSNGRPGMVIVTNYN